MIIFRKLPREANILELLAENALQLEPLSFRLLKTVSKIQKKQTVDAFIELSWGKIKVKFGVECKSPATPKIIRDAINAVKTVNLPSDYYPMVIAPFFNEQQLRELEQEGISGIDLCGNGVVVVPDKLAIFKTGAPNRFPNSAPIKNVYQKNSSMVPRLLLVSPLFRAVKDILKAINDRNSLMICYGKLPMSFSTVSKVLKSLEEDLIVGRSEEIIRLLQPDKLIEKLTENFTKPIVNELYRCKVSLEGSQLQDKLMKEAKTLGLPIVATGTTSVSRYAVMQRGNVLSVYCPRGKKLIDRLPRETSDRFVNLEIIETEDETFYFDSRSEQGFYWASPVQVYLELMAGDKRDQETALQLKDYLLKHLEPLLK